MKRTIAAIVILVLLLGLGTFEQIYFHRTIDVMQRDVSEILTLVRATPDAIATDETKARTSDFLDYWDKHKHNFQMLLSHTYTLEIDRNTSVLRNHLEQNDYLMTTTDLSALLECCNLLRELITPHLHTIL